MVAPVKKVAKKRAPRLPKVTGAVDVDGLVVVRTGSTTVRGSNLSVLAGVINAVPGKVVSVVEGQVDGDAGWLVVWEEIL